MIEQTTITLTDALPGEKDLLVHMKIQFPPPGGPLRVLDAFATAPGYNGVSHTVEVTQAKQNRDGSVQFDLRFTIHPDAWLPANRTMLKGSVQITLRRAEYEWVGSYTGKLGEDEIKGAVTLNTAYRHPRPDTQQPRETLIEIRLDSLPLADVKQWQKQAFLILSVRDGQVVSGTLKPYGSSSYAVWSGYPSDLDLQLKDHTIAGRLTLQARIGNQPRLLPIVIELEGSMIGDIIAGQVRYTPPAEIGSPSTHRFRGEVDPRQVTMKRAQIILSLDAAIDSRAMLRVYLQVENGQVVEGFGFSPTYNRAVHTIDVSNLKLEQGRLTGTMPTVIEADPFIPEDGQAQSYSYELDLPLTGRAGIGRFEARQGERVMKPGVVTAQLDVPTPQRETPRVWLKFEDGLVGGSAWQNRAFAAFRIDEQGRASTGSFSTNKRVWQGEFIEAEVALTSTSLTGHLTSRVTSGKVRKATYRFELKGRRVGDIIAGTFTTKIDGQTVKTGLFLGAISDGESDQQPDAIRD